MRYRLCSVLLLCLCCAVLAVPAGAAMKIMPLGDSITRGGPGADTAFASYRYYLDASLRASGYGADFVGSLASDYTRFIFDQQHEGHGGYTTGMMVGTPSFSPLVSWLAASPTPEIVLLHVGTNDALNGVPVAARLANVKQIVTLLRQRNPKVRVMVAQIIPTANATLNLKSGLVEFNTALPSLVAGISTEASPVTVVDLYTGYDGVADNQPDGIHPRATGERKMAAAWQRALMPVLAAASPTATTKPTAATPKPNAIPGTLEAENYNTGGEGVAYHDTTSTNQGGAYRSDGVDVEAISGGYAIDYVRDGEWLKYTIDAAAAGKYTAAFRVASWGSASHAIEVSVNDKPTATVTVSTTGSYDAWTTATTTLSLPAGSCTLKFRFVGDGQNLDKVIFTPVAVTTTLPPTTAPTGAGRPVPGTVEAEDYDAGGEGVGYHDTTAGNHDNVYRHDNVDLSVNPSGGYNVGYVVDGEWLAYTLAVPSAGTYTVACTVASWADGRSLALALDGTPLGTLAVPNNLGVGWKTVSTRVALPAGDHRLVVRFVGDRQTLDRLTVAAVATSTTTVPTSAAPTSKANAIPGTLEAEDYATGGEGTGYHDLTQANLGGAYRSDGVDIESLPGGGYAVGYVRDGEWLRYSVPVAAAGKYTAAFRVAAWGTASHAIEVLVNDQPAATVAVPATGSYDAWSTATATLSLPAGTSSLKLRFVGDGQNLDNVVFTPVAVTTTPTTIATTASPTGKTIPGTLEAEDYNTGGEGVAYHDTTSTNQGGAYRSDGVDIEAISGGYAVGYVRDGEWLKYTVPVASTGKYTAVFRVAAWGMTSHAIEVSVNDKPAATVTVPATGAYDAWSTATTTLSLPAGSSTLKFRFVGDGQNLDKVIFTPVAVTTTPPPTVTPTLSGGRPVPGSVEAEDYDAGGEGVGYHDTTAGNHDNVYRHDNVDLSVNPSGGYNVGYVVDGEWLAYTLAVPSAGTYTVACTVASWADGRSLALALDGTPLGTLAVPNNLGVGWKTVSTRVALPAGDHRLVVRFVGDRQTLDRLTVAAIATPTTTIPTTVQTTLGGSVRLPARIQAENYAAGGEGVGYHDTTAGNQGGAYRSDGVDIAYAPSIWSYVVTRIQPGEWLEYAVDAPEERDYPLVFRLSSPNGGQLFELQVDGRSEVTVNTPRTGSYDAYAEISTQVRLTKGAHRIRIQFSGDGQNFDAFELA